MITQTLEYLFINTMDPRAPLKSKSIATPTTHEQNSESSNKPKKHSPRNKIDHAPPRMHVASLAMDISSVLREVIRTIAHLIATLDGTWVRTGRKVDVFEMTNQQ